MKETKERIATKLQIPKGDISRLKASFFDSSEMKNRINDGKERRRKKGASREKEEGEN
jgi:hypothetical protein